MTQIMILLSWASGSAVSAELLGYLLHRLLHSGWIAFLSRNHMRHHLVIYGPLQEQHSPAYLDATDNHIFRNTFRDIEGIVMQLGRAHGTRFEFECYDIGHLYNLAYMLDRKVVEFLRERRGMAALQEPVP